VSNKYALAARLTVNLVAESLMHRHAWDMNTALSKLSKTEIYERLIDHRTQLWTENPSDLATMVDLELDGKEVPAEMFFK
jgi:hypothetical protein